MSILRFLFQTLCAFLQIKDRKHIEQNFHSVAEVMPQGRDLGVLGGSKTYWGFVMAPHRLRILVCLFRFLFLFVFFFFIATCFFHCQSRCPFLTILFIFIYLYLILMNLFLCFGIFKQFGYLAKCFDNTCKTYTYAKLKTSSLQKLHTS